MKTETKKLLFDILEAGESILTRCEGRSLAEYAADRWFRRTVEREFEIIGEALNRLERVDQFTASQVPHLRRIVDFRNRLIHGYDSLDDEIVWGIVEKHLPLLKHQVGILLAHSEAEEEG